MGDATMPGGGGVGPGSGGPEGVNAGRGGAIGGARPRPAGSKLAALAAAHLPAVLALLAEAGWISAVYALLEIVRGEGVIVGPLGFAIAACAGALASGWGRRRFGEAWPVAGTALVAAAAVVGWLVADATRSALLAAGPGRAFGEHPGGWLLGLAFLRGIAQARGRDEEAAPSGSLLAVGVPALVLVFVFGGALAEPERTTFRDAAFGDAMLFVAAGLVGLTLGRVQAVGSLFGLDWYRNPVWVALLLAFVAGLLAVAVPASATLGAVVVLLVAALPVPLFFAGLLLGIDRRMLGILLITLGLPIIAVILIRLLFHDRTGTLVPGGGGGTPAPTDNTGPLLAVASGIVAIVVVAIAIGLLVALWMRRALVVADGAVAEERVIDRGSGGLGWTWRGRHADSRRPGEPHDAAQAYLAALAVLEGRDELRRSAGETPAEHARRLRAAHRTAAGGAPAPGAAPLPGALAVPPAITRLAADYELVRFGGRELSPREHHRALGRWESIRRAVGGGRHSGR